MVNLGPQAEASTEGQQQRLYSRFFEAYPTALPTSILLREQNMHCVYMKGGVPSDLEQSIDTLVSTHS